MSRRPTLPPSFPPREQEVEGEVEVGVAVASHDRVSERLVDRLTERRRARMRLRVRALALSAVAVLVLAGAGYITLASPLLALQMAEVEVAGADEIAPADQVLAVVEAHEGVPLLRLDTAAIRADLLELPGVLEATVHRALPHGLVVTVVPRTPVATVEDGGSFVLLDVEGVELARGEEPAEGVPVVEVPVGSEATAAALTAVLSVMDALPPELLAQVARVSAPTAYEVEFELDSGARVVWGSAEENDLKVAVLSELLAVPASVYDVSAPLSPITR